MNGRSPNECWRLLGYTIERDERRARTIRRPDGSVVDIPRAEGVDPYDAELAAAEKEMTTAADCAADARC